MHRKLSDQSSKKHQADDAGRPDAVLSLIEDLVVSSTIRRRSASLCNAWIQAACRDMGRNLVHRPEVPKRRSDLADRAQPIYNPTDGRIDLKFALQLLVCLLMTVIGGWASATFRGGDKRGSASGTSGINKRDWDERRSRPCSASSGKLKRIQQSFAWRIIVLAGVVSVESHQAPQVWYSCHLRQTR